MPGGLVFDGDYEEIRAEMLMKYSGVGRYHPGICDFVAKAGENGRSLNEISRALGISLSTLLKWCELHEELRHACAYARTARTGALENCLRTVIETGAGGREAVRGLEFLLKAASPEYRETGIKIRAAAQIDGGEARAAIVVQITPEDNDL